MSRNGMGLRKPIMFEFLRQSEFLPHARGKRAFQNQTLSLFIYIWFLLYSICL